MFFYILPKIARTLDLLSENSKICIFMLFLFLNLLTTSLGLQNIPSPHPYHWFFSYHFFAKFLADKKKVKFWILLCLSLHIFICVPPARTKASVANEKEWEGGGKEREREREREKKEPFGGFKRMNNIRTRSQSLKHIGTMNFLSCHLVARSAKFVV